MHLRQEAPQSLLERQASFSESIAMMQRARDQPLHCWGAACLPEGLYDFSLPPLVEHRESCIWTPYG